MSPNPVFSNMNEQEASRFMYGKENCRSRQEIADIVGERTVLDLGCGKGTSVYMLYSTHQYTGIDCSPELIRMAAANNPGYRFAVWDLEDELPFRADVGVMRSVLEHVPSLEAAKRIYRNALAACDEVIVLWHTPPKFDETRIIRVPCELDGEINQNQYQRGSFETEGIEVEHRQSGAFSLWICHRC